MALQLNEEQLGVLIAALNEELDYLSGVSCYLRDSPAHMRGEAAITRLASQTTEKALAIQGQLESCEMHLRNLRSESSSSSANQ